jgi:hypothetical protein
MFNSYFNGSSWFPGNYWASFVERTLEDVEVFVKNLQFFTPWANHTLASRCVNLAFLDVSDAKVHLIMHTREKMTKFPGEAVLNVKQCKHVIKHGWPQPWRGGVARWTQCSGYEIRNVDEL